MSRTRKNEGVKGVLKAWNADFRGFGGFSRILSGVFFKIRVNKNLRNLCSVSFLWTQERIRENPLNPRKSAFHNFLNPRCIKFI